MKEWASDQISRKAYSRPTCPIPALAPNITKPLSPELPGSHAAANSLALRQNLTEIYFRFVNFRALRLHPLTCQVHIYLTIP